MDGFKITRRESLNLRIEMAHEALVEERARREKRGLPSFHIPSFTKARRLRFKKMYPIKDMRTVLVSRKYLCGTLSVLCNRLRELGIKYPWKD